MSSQSRHSTSSRPPPKGNTTGAIGQGPNASPFPRRAHARPVNIPERRLWLPDRPKFYIHDSSGSSQGGSSTKSSGGSSTTSEGREGQRVHTVSPYGSFFVADMELDSRPAADSNSPNRGGKGGGGWTRGTATTTADLNRVLYQTSARRPPSNQNDLFGRQYQVATGLFESTEPTYCDVGISGGALPVPGRNVHRGGEETPSTLTTSTHRSQSNHHTSWNREYRNRSNSPHDQAHNCQAHRHRVITGTALPPGSYLSNSDRQKTRGMNRTSWRK